MAADTEIKQDPRPRRIGGVILALIGLPLTLLSVRALTLITPGLFELVLFSGGPFLLALGIWAIASNQHVKVRLRISDDAIVVAGKPDVTIPLDDLRRVRLVLPWLGKHERLTLETSTAETQLDVVHFPVAARDIVSMISARLENRGAYLEEGRGEITGARNGIWEVKDGRPFA